MSKKTPSVKDLVIPPRAITRWGVAYFAWYVLLPVLLLLGAIDAALYVVFTYGFDSCYGVFCWI